MTSEHPGVPARLTRKGAATRERILSVAAELMYHQGVERTSLSDVIEASGTGKSQVYHYFGDKAALIEGVVEVQIHRVLSGQASLLDEVRTVRGLERWRDAEVAFARSRHGRNGCPIGSLSSELADQSASARRRLAEGFSHWESQLHQALIRIQESGEIASTASPHDLARGLLASLQGGLLLAQATRDSAHLENALDLALDHIRSWAPQEA